VRVRRGPRLLFLGKPWPGCDNANVDSGARRRKHPRVPLSTSAPTVFQSVRVLHAGEEGVGRIINIAEEGVFLQTDLDVALGTAAVLRLVLSSGPLCQAEGRVVWRAESGVGLGLSLPNSNEALREFVGRLAAVESADELLAVIREIREADVRFGSEP